MIIHAGAEQRLPEIAPEAVLQESPSSRTRRAGSTTARPAPTATSLRPSRVALATTLYPESQMNPVFMPSAPGTPPIGRYACA